MTAYPSYWEADVVLRDGGTAHLRPIVPDDADALQRMHENQSPESIYLRFFAPMPTLPEKDLHRFVTVDYHDRVAFVMCIGEEIIGVGRYDRIDSDSAEVAFNIADAHQGRGIGSILLEHLAAAALERGIRVFTAEVLPQNRSMLQVFAAAGYAVTRGFDDGVVAVRFEIDPTHESLQVKEAREHRAEALSVHAILHPSSVVVIGASRRRSSTGNLIVRNLVDSGFAGTLAIVHPEADEIAGVSTVRSLEDLTEPVDLAVIAVPAEAVSGAVRDCAAHGVRAVVVISSGFAEVGDAGRALQQEVLATARSHGMRLVGPNSFGLANTAEDVSLNASLAPFLPERGTLGLFSQSGALATALLAHAARRGLGISSFVSAGNRADLSGNDMLQYWEEDPATSTVGLYLESIGNPRKFSRIARRVSRVKPVIVVKSDFTGRELPPGHEVRISGLSGGALDEVLTQAGAIRADTIQQLFDVAQVFSAQPPPAGRRVGIIGNSAAMGTLILQRARAEGLDVTAEPVSLHPEVGAEEFDAALAEMFARSDVDSVIVSFTPSVGADERDITARMAEYAARSEKTTVACVVGVQGVAAELTAFVAGESGRTQHSVPSFFGPEEAVWALARTVDYAEWRRRDHGVYPELTGIDRRAARAIVERELARDGRDVSGTGRTMLGPDAAAELLRAYGIEPLPYTTTRSEAEALAAAEELGYPVAIKAVHTRLRHRMELGGVMLNIETPEELRDDYAIVRDVIAGYVGDDGDLAVDVQAMAPPGTACVVRAGEDPLLGPMVSFSLAGDTTELLGDIAHRVAPLTDADAYEMIRSVRAAPRLFGYKGLPVLNVAPIEDVLLRVAEMVDDFPEIALLEIHPIVATQTDAHILSARIELLDDVDRVDSARRRMS